MNFKIEIEDFIKIGNKQGYVYNQASEEGSLITKDGWEMLFDYCETYREEKAFSFEDLQDEWMELKDLEAFNKLCFDEDVVDYYESLEACEDERIVIKTKSSVLFQSAQYAVRKSYRKEDERDYSLAHNLLRKT